MLPDTIMQALLLASTILNLCLLVWVVSRLARGTSAEEETIDRLDQLDARMSETQSFAQAGFSALREDFAHATSETRADARHLREEVGASLHRLGTQTMTTLDGATRRQAEGLQGVAGRLHEMSEANERRQEALRQTLEGRLDRLRQENAAKLEEMRVTVDEKLQGTLEQRLGASFNTVNENLERVFRSVGEMQSIATGVGDLKRVLSNVKARGTWGEATLGMALEQVMTPEQYATNVEVRPHSGQRVEYAIRLPGDGADPVWLPIDAKLPTEDYERLVDASERGDADGVDEASKGLDRAIRKAAADIAAKYVQPPHTTDFAVMFLPTEGLFAEVVRRPGLIDQLQRESRVIVTGPTTLMALLTSLRMGFRSLAIQERSSEVWQVLGGVKSEFARFGDMLDKVQKKLGEAQTAVDGARTRGRAIDRRLRAVDDGGDGARHHPLLVGGDDVQCGPLS